MSELNKLRRKDRLLPNSQVRFLKNKKNNRMRDRKRLEERICVFLASIPAILGLTLVVQMMAQTQVPQGQKGSTSPKAAQPKAAAPKKATEPVAVTPLIPGGTGYVRVRDYATKPLKDATPAGDANKFQFGDAVMLVQKKDGPPFFWLVSKDQSQSWVPSYLLTANKAEIDFLKGNDRVPDSMALVYREDNWKVWGTERMNLGGFSMTVDAEGTLLLAYREGTSPFAIKGNAVVFDGSALEPAHFIVPPVFDSAKKAFQLSPHPFVLRGFRRRQFSV